MCCPVSSRPGIIARVTADGAVQWRAITAEDGAEWARLVLAVEESYGREEILGADDLVEDLRDPDVDPERGTIAAFSEGSMIAYAGLRASPGLTGRHEMYLSGAVHPGQRGRGLGTRLLAWAEQAAPPLHFPRATGSPGMRPGRRRRPGRSGTRRSARPSASWPTSAASRPGYSSPTSTTPSARRPAAASATSPPSA